MKKRISLFEEYSQSLTKTNNGYVLVKDESYRISKYDIIDELWHNNETLHTIQTLTCTKGDSVEYIGICDDPQYFFIDESPMHSNKWEHFIKITGIYQKNGYDLRIDKNVKAFNLLNVIYGKRVDLILNSKSTYLTIYTLVDNQQKYEFKNIFEVANMMKHGDYFLYPMLQYIFDKIQKLNAVDAFEKIMKLIEINMPHVIKFLNIPDVITKDEDESEMF
jgi:hypothetical protein